jgi:hypothetical protein
MYFSMRITSGITSWSFGIKSWDTVYSCLDFMMLIIMRSEVLSAAVMYIFREMFTSVFTESVAFFFYPEGGSSTCL